MSSIVLDSPASHFAVRILPLTGHVIPPHIQLHIAIKKKAFPSLLYWYNFTLFQYAFIYDMGKMWAKEVLFWNACLSTHNRYTINAGGAVFSIVNSSENLPKPIMQVAWQSCGLRNLTPKPKEGLQHIFKQQNPFRYLYKVWGAMDRWEEIGHRELKKGTINKLQVRERQKMTNKTTAGSFSLPSLILPIYGQERLLTKFYPVFKT